MNYSEALEAARHVARMRRQGWDDCKIIRSATTADYEYLNYPTDGLVVQDCATPKCDCKVSIYYPTPEDVTATDWVAVAA